MTLQIDLSQLYAFVSKINGFQAVLAEELLPAGDSSIGKVLTDIPANCSWQNSSGKLDSSWQKLSVTPYLASGGSDIPYARRRAEFGFHGADSLGRVYNDGATYFVSSTLDNDTPDIEQFYIDAINRTLIRLGAI